jgi:hypothetical protein
VQRTAAQARKSALSVAAVLLLLAAWNVWRNRPTVYFVLGGLGGALLLTGMLWPSGARAFDRAWMRFAALLGYINSRIILSGVYFLVMAPYGWVMKLFGRNILNRRGPGSGTYWIPRKRTRQLPMHFERQF